MHSLHLNEPISSADAWFVLEGTLPGDIECEVPPNRTFFLGAETARPLGYYYDSDGWLGYLGQFFEIHSPQELYWENATLDFPFLPWMINANHGEKMLDASKRDFDFLQNFVRPEKKHQLSVFCSTKSFTPGHAARLRFVRELKQHFGDRLAWFGNGVNPLKEKWFGLEPYEYTIVLENQSASHVLTEKIQDAFLALSKPIYWGAPEARDLFPEKSFAEIDIRDLDGTILRIETLLKEESYGENLEALLEAKKVVTGRLNFMERILEIASSSSLPSPLTPQLTRIHPVSYFSGNKSQYRSSVNRGAAWSVIKRVGRR